MKDSSWSGSTTSLTRSGLQINRWKLQILVIAVFCVFLLAFTDRSWPPRRVPLHVRARRRETLEKCRYIRTPAGPPTNFHARKQSDRFVPGTSPVLFKNAKVITGDRNGTEVVYGDVLLDKGIIKAVGYIPPNLWRDINASEVEVKDVQGAWVTPGLVDLHSHIAVYSSPALRGARDGNSVKAPVLPWMRSIDSLNTHDASYKLSIAGGVTTAQILPGSADNIGGQAFVIKLRPTSERSAISKVIEPPYTLNGSHFDHSLKPRWRHMKHACGENPSRVYSQTRMDSAWEFRHAYDTARKLRDAQDTYCTKAEAGLWDELGDFPEDLQWEALVDVLRGKVKLSVHCYEAVDLDGIVRLTNEFQFPVASFHHAAETYLVPDLLKKTYGGAPSIALFASNARKKRESYRGSEFAPRILASQGIPVVMKSDHPVINSRYLLHEASQVFYYGLDAALAIASVTSTPANAMGLGHRIGHIKEGYDADVVIWDSHPLTLGATPKQVYIDGIPQLASPQVLSKPSIFQVLPETPNFDEETADTVEYEGLPPLEPRKAKHVMFTNVRSMYTRAGRAIVSMFTAEDREHRSRTVVVRDGSIVCADDHSSCASFFQEGSEVIDLQDGSLSPGFTTTGSTLGLVEILLEPSTSDGYVLDPLSNDIPSILGGPRTVVRAADGLQFGGRNTLLAYRAGVTTAIPAPIGRFFLHGLSTGFSTGASNALEEDAILQEETALHVTIERGGPVSVSTQIAALRRLLSSPSSASEGLDHWMHVREGALVLAVHVESADIMATLIVLKEEHLQTTGHTLRLTFVGAAESHLLAKEIGEAGVSVVLTPSRPFPEIWDQLRTLPGPPLTANSTITTLLGHGVNVGIGVTSDFTARNTRFDVAWAALEANGTMSKSQAIALATTNVEQALGFYSEVVDDLVVYQAGDALDLQSKVVGVVSRRRRTVDLF